MTTVKIIRGSNKRLNGKEFIYREGQPVKIGRTNYVVIFNVHQPNINKGDYKPVECTINDLKPFRLMREDNPLSTGINIYEYTINK